MADDLQPLLALLELKFVELLDVQTQLLAVKESQETAVRAGKAADEVDAKAEAVLLTRRDFLLTEIGLIKIQNGVLP